MEVFAVLSLVLGLIIGLAPFWEWRLILPSIISRPKVSLLVKFILLAKFGLLAVVLYLLSYLTWLNISWLAGGLVLAPFLGIIWLLLKPKEVRT